MAVPSYYRELRRFLKDSYGVVDVSFGYASTGHQRWSFDYNGRPYTITLHGQNSGGKTNILAMKKADLRRQLGPPPPPCEPRRKRSLEDMMSTIEAKPFVPPPGGFAEDKSSPSYIGRLACYMTSAGKTLLEFSIGRAGMEGWSDSRIKVVELGPEDWKISRDPEGRKLVQVGNKWIRFQIVTNTVREGFGLSPADVVEVDGALMFHCPTATRVRVAASRRAPSPTDTARKPVAVEPAPSASDAIGWSVVGLRKLLDLVRRMEESTPYRVTRLPDGSIAFSAPTIK